MLLFLLLLFLRLSLFLRFMARVAVWGALQRTAIVDVAVEHRLLQVLNRQHAVGRQSDKGIEDLEVLAQNVSLGGY